MGKDQAELVADIFVTIVGLPTLPSLRALHPVNSSISEGWKPSAVDLSEFQALLLAMVFVSTLSPDVLT